MTRPLRIEFEGAHYHVMHRGRNRCRIFHSDEYYSDFLACLEEAHQRFALEIHAYCLMDNHYHLMVSTPRGNLGRAMRHIDGVYTQRYNRRKGTDGSLFRGRYKSILIDTSSYALQVSRYIHRNPIELKRPLVKSLEQYLWSSYPSYVNRVPPPFWLNRELIYAEISSRHRYKAYKSFVDSGIDNETAEFYGKKRQQSILGDKVFQESARKLIIEDVEIDKQGVTQLLPLEDIIHRVAYFYKVEVQDICIAKRGRREKNIPRWIAMKLYQELGGAKLSEIAKAFNVGHYSTVSQTIRRLNKLMIEDGALKNKLKQLSQDLTP